jgi:16S rRNA (guanine(1405)-N(7))-methyltransferase
MNNLPKQLIDNEIKSICSRYKIEPESVFKHFNTVIQRHPKLIQKIKANTSDDISRLKAYKHFIKDVKKTIYYQLRQYHQDTANENDLKQRLANLHVDNDESGHMSHIVKDLLASHVSTKERLPYYDNFYSHLFQLIDPPQTIIDIGCGLHPLSYPFKQKTPLKTYFAIDKDVSVIDVLELFAPHIVPIQLKPVCMNIKDIVWSDLPDQDAPFDLAIMLKLIPVIHRQDKSALKQLFEIPAKKILLTGNTESMTRRENIRRKEEQILRQYIEMADREIIGYFHNDNEFGMII